MQRMNELISIRLPKEDLEMVKQLSLQDKKDKSTIVRDLVEQGKMYRAITQYADGRISIGKATEIAGITISEFMDHLTKLGIKSNLQIEDYLEGKKAAKKLFS